MVLQIAALSLGVSFDGRAISINGLAITAISSYNSEMTTAQIEAASATFRIAAVETASAAIGKMEPGCRIIGITKGQFSLLDLLRAVLAQTGPADVIVSTWTTGIRDAENAGWLLANGDMTSFTLLTDRSFPKRQPKYCRRVRELFGEESILATNTHAKFAMVRNKDWRVVIRSSMNLNRNKRFEQFDIDDSREMYEFFLAFVDEIRRTTPNGITSSEAEVEAGFQRALLSNTVGGERAEDDPDTPERVIAQLAGLQFTRAEIALLLELSDEEQEQLADEATPMGRAYIRGQLEIAREIRRSIRDQATGGDIKAIEHFSSLVRQRESRDG